jgi:hemerythrin-like domain-containing protein
MGFAATRAGSTRWQGRFVTDALVSGGPRRSFDGMAHKFAIKRGLSFWAPIGMGAAGLVAGGMFGARRRSTRRASRVDPFADYVTRFRLSHEALRRNLRRFIDIVEQPEPFDGGAFGDFLRLYSRFLIVHHESEDRVIFPTLRRYGRLRSTDAAHLQRWGTEHRDVNAAAEALTRVGERVRESGKQARLDVVRASQELETLLAPHLSSEEELFTPAHLAEIVPAKAIGEIDREARRLFSGERDIPLFFAHSLQPAEQKQVFASAPWIFRRVIFPLMDRRAFPRFKPFAVSPALDA